MMELAKITPDGRYLAQCQKCGAWVEVFPETFHAEGFFVVRQGRFRCCGLQQAATFTQEKDEIDFH